MRWLIPLILMAIATPAWASGSAITEPSSMALFGLGLVGVLVGRHYARNDRD